MWMKGSHQGLVAYHHTKMMIWIRKWLRCGRELETQLGTAVISMVIAIIFFTVNRWVMGSILNHPTTEEDRVETIKCKQGQVVTAQNQTPPGSCEKLDLAIPSQCSLQLSHSQTWTESQLTHTGCQLLCNVSLMIGSVSKVEEITLPRCSPFHWLFFGQYS